jgi:hypothetical protein
MLVTEYLVKHLIGQKEFTIIILLCSTEMVALVSLISLIVMLANYYLMMMGMKKILVQVMEKLGAQVLVHLPMGVKPVHLVVSRLKED